MQRKSFDQIRQLEKYTLNFILSLSWCSITSNLPWKLFQKVTFNKRIYSFNADLPSNETLEHSDEGGIHDWYTFAHSSSQFKGTLLVQAISIDVDIYNTLSFEIDLWSDGYYFDAVWNLDGVKYWVSIKE